MTENLKRNLDPSSRGPDVFAGFAVATALILVLRRHLQVFLYPLLKEQGPVEVWRGLWTWRWEQGAVFLSMAAAGLFLALLIWRFPRSRRKPLVIACIPLLGILLLAALSLQWSWADQATYRALWLLLGMTIPMVYLGFNYEIELVARLFTAAAAFLIVVNLLVVFAVPEQAVMVGKWAGAWQGIFLHKNALGQVAAFANLVFLIRLANFRSETWAARAYHAVFCALSVILVLGSDSAAALMLLVVNLAVLLGALLVIQWADRLKPVHWLGVGVLGIAALVATWWQRHLIVVVILGKTPTLTGRIPLWLSLVPHIEKKLLLGYGFGNAFWKHEDHVRQIFEKVQWFPGSAHNGFLDILLSLGLVGGLIYAAFFIETFLFSIGYLLRARTATSVLPIMLACYAVSANMTASNLVSVQLLAWPALVVAWATCVRALVLVPEQKIVAEESKTDLARGSSAAPGTP